MRAGEEKEVSLEIHLTEKLHLNHFADIGTECIKTIIKYKDMDNNFYIIGMQFKDVTCL